MSKLALLSRVVFAHRREKSGGSQREHCANARPLPDSDGHDRDRDPMRDAAQRLERISVYARAGYFHMSYTYEMYPLVGELPHE